MPPPPADPRRPTPAGAAIAPLTGYTVALATERRRSRLAAPLEEAGAKVVAVQALRVVAQPDEDELRAATERCLAAPIDELVVSSPFGFRSWLASTQRWHLTDQLVAAFELSLRNWPAQDPRHR